MFYCSKKKALSPVWVGIAFLKSLSSTFVLQELQKRSAEKGLEILLRQGYGGQKGGGLFLRFSQLVTTESYNEADVSVSPQKVFFPALTPQNLFADLCREQRFFLQFTLWIPAAGEGRGTKAFL